MSAKKNLFHTLSIVAAGWGLVMISSVLIIGQTAKQHDTPWVDDWTHHRLVFSNPGTASEALAQGRLEQWTRTVNNPRYHLQQLKRSSAQAAIEAAPDFASRMAILNSRNQITISNRLRRRPAMAAPIKKDWSQEMDGAVAAGSINVSSALAAGTISATSQLNVGSVTFQASPPTPATCTVTVATSYCFAAGDGVAINGVNITTNATKVNGSVNFSGTLGSGETVTVAGITYASHGSSGACGTENATNVCVMHGGSTADSVADLEAAINNNPAQCSATGKTEGGGTTCFFTSPSQAHPNVTATVGTGVVNIIPRCAGAFSMTACSAGACTVSGTTTGTNGTTSGANFAVANPPLNTTVAANMATAIGNQTATDHVTAAAGGTNVVTATASTPGTTANGTTAALHGTPTGVTVSGNLAGGTDGTADATHFTYWTGSTYVAQSVLATTLANIINNNTTLQGVGGVVAGTPSGNTFTVTARSGGPNPVLTVAGGFTALTLTAFSGGAAASVLPNALPAKYGASLTTASCSDFVVFPTGVAGSATSANIVAYNNLYTGTCSGVPSVLWAYNTDNGYSVTTSPVISVDGTQVAFIESNGATSKLVVLPTASGGGSVGSPATLPGAISYTTLSHPDTYSSPFYDNNADNAVYVGDDTGNLEKFTGVFAGAITGPSTINLGHAVPLASPVYDATSGCVYVGDTSGFLYRANSGVAGGVCVSGTYAANGLSLQLGSAASGGIFDGPLVDGSLGSVYVFVTSSVLTGACAATTNCVDQFPTNFVNGGSPSHNEPLGTGGVGTNLFDGAFDNTYFSSGPGTGNLYAVGNTGSAAGGNLYRVTITTNAIAGVTTSITGVNGAARPWPSPLTEFLNGAIDYLFFSVNMGKQAGCTNAAGNGCVLSYNITTTTPALSGSGLNVTTPGTNGCWATGGIVIDNSGAQAGAQQIYFVNLNGATAAGTNTCTAGTAGSRATQASQTNP